MVPDRKVLPVRHQRLLLAPEHDAHVGRMVYRRVKIGVVANVCGEVHRSLPLGYQGPSSELSVALECSVILAENLLQRAAGLQPVGPAKGHERVQRRLGEHLLPALHERAGEQVADGLQVQDLVANRHADPGSHITGRGEHAVRQVLDREVAAGVVLDEALHGGAGVVRLRSDGVLEEEVEYGDGDSREGRGRADRVGGLRGAAPAVGVRLLAATRTDGGV